MSFKKGYNFIVVSGLLSVFFLSSCQDTPVIEKVTPESIVGTWRVNGGPQAYQSVEFLGSREFKIDRNGDGNIDILGYYNLVSERMIFKDKGGIIIPECSRDGVYIPKLQKNKLSFELIRDECRGRLEAMKYVWQKSA